MYKKNREFACKVRIYVGMRMYVLYVYDGDKYIQTIEVAGIYQTQVTGLCCVLCFGWLMYRYVAFKMVMWCGSQIVCVCTFICVLMMGDRCCMVGMGE